MKNNITLCLLLALVCVSTAAFSQNSKELTPGYYVIAGAYSSNRENIAQNYSAVLNKRGFKTDYGFDSQKNYYFVYLNYTTDLKSALRALQTFRKQEEFKQAWVRVIPGQIPVLPPNTKIDRLVDNTGQTDSTNNTNPVTSLPQDIAVGKEDVKDSVELAKDNQKGPSGPGYYDVFLHLYHARNNRIVDGTVKIIDTDRARLIDETKGNENLALPDPKSHSKQLTLICDAFGYRKIQTEINYPITQADTANGNIEWIENVPVINFDLVRYHKGDIVTLYNVYFYNDAALMLPESKYELNSLLQLMQENPNYKIRLHGHANGNYSGKIITLGENKNFFALDSARQGIGTSKALSRSRAEVIKEYLVANEIDPERVEIRAWGGKRPIYDKHSVNAKKNVRVEVEILEDGERPLYVLSKEKK